METQEIINSREENQNQAGMVGSDIRLSKKPSEDDTSLLLYLSIFGPYIAAQGKSAVLLDKGRTI